MSDHPTAPAKRINPRWRQILGRAAEEHAAHYLRRRGCLVIERRFGRREGEIDLIVEHQGTVVFVEVKARRGDGFGDPVEAVTARKRQRIVATARRFLAARQWRSRCCRFDVVSVRLSGGRATVEWLRDAFRP